MNREKLENKRYGMDIRGLSTHAEMNGLEELLRLLEGQSGHVQVLDRNTGHRILEGSVEEVRAQLLRSHGSALAGTAGPGSYESSPRQARNKRQVPWREVVRLTNANLTR